MLTDSEVSSPNVYSLQTTLGKKLESTFRKAIFDFDMLDFETFKDQKTIASCIKRRQR